MSIKLMNAVWENPEPRGLARLCLLALADQANDEGYCWPSYETIAKRVGLNDRHHAMKIVKRLQDLGFVEVQKRFNEDLQTSNMYRVVVYPHIPGGIPTYTRVVYPGIPKPPINHQLTNTTIGDGEAYKAYINMTGDLSPHMADKIGSAVADYSEEWVLEAIKESIENNVRKWTYAEAILKAWKLNGFKTDTRKKRPGQQNKSDIGDWR